MRFVQFNLECPKGKVVLVRDDAVLTIESVPRVTTFDSDPTITYVCIGGAGFYVRHSVDEVRKILEEA